MHEFAFTKVIYNRVRAIAEREGAERVTDVHLAIGELRGMINDWVARYFAYVGKGTITEGAEVHIETIPGSVRCEDCGAIAPMSLEGSRAGASARAPLRPRCFWIGTVRCPRAPASARAS